MNVLLDISNDSLFHQNARLAKNKTTNKNMPKLFSAAKYSSLCFLFDEVLQLSPCSTFQNYTDITSRS